MADKTKSQAAANPLIEALSGALRGLTTDTVGAPVDLINMALKAFGAPTVEAPVGGSKWMRKLLDQPQEDSGVATAGNLASALASPGKAAVDMAQLLPMLAGAIRKGGREDLALVHNMNMDYERSRRWWDSTAPMSNPSIAVTKTANPYPFGELPTLVFNPNSHYFDPKYQNSNKLYNRDAYTSRSKGYSKADTDRRLGTEDLRLTEGATPGYIQGLAIRQSPDFMNFAHFEKSKAGAVGLDQGFKHADADVVEEYVETFKQLTQKELGIDLHDPDLLTKYLNKLADPTSNLVKHGDVSRELTGMATITKRALREGIGSNYGELKRWGNLPVDSRTTRAVIIPSSYEADDDIIKAVISGADRRGIPWGPIGKFAGQKDQDAIHEAAMAIGDKTMYDRDYTKLDDMHDWSQINERERILKPILEPFAPTDQAMYDLLYGLRYKTVPREPDLGGIINELSETQPVRDRTMQWLTRFLDE